VKRISRKNGIDQGISIEIVACAFGVGVWLMRIDKSLGIVHLLMIPCVAALSRLLFYCCFVHANTTQKGVLTLKTVVGILLLLGFCFLPMKSIPIKSLLGTAMVVLLGKGFKENHTTTINKRSKSHEQPTGDS
jgi:hypothetical protein